MEERFPSPLPLRKQRVLVLDHEGNVTELETTQLEQLVLVDYTNWKGNRRWRPIIPRRLVWSVNDHYHPGPQWLLEADDVEDQSSSYVKLFALQNIHGWRPVVIPKSGPVEGGSNP